MIDFGKWTESEINALLGTAQKMPTPGGRIGFLTKQFLGVPYQSGTLTGSDTVPEQFVVNLSAVDCFTLLDYLEAMQRSATCAEFLDVLRCVRYRNCAVEYCMRHHFFSDWSLFQQDRIDDVTAQIGGDCSVSAAKRLNLRADGTCWIPGIPPFKREITFIPSGSLNARVLAGLRTGDYAGIYTDLAGLDVTHVGVIVKGPFITYLRHASSAPGKMRVIDDDLVEYLANKPGLIVYRAK
jgi:hypothetical protein